MALILQSCVFYEEIASRSSLVPTRTKPVSHYPAVDFETSMKLRFSIRDLLWLTLVVALAMGWWLDHRRLTHQLEIDELIHLIQTTVAPST